MEVTKVNDGFTMVVLTGGEMNLAERQKKGLTNDVFLYGDYAGTRYIDCKDEKTLSEEYRYNRYNHNEPYITEALRKNFGWVSHIDYENRIVSPAAHKKQMRELTQRDEFIKILNDGGTVVLRSNNVIECYDCKDLKYRYHSGASSREWNKINIRLFWDNFKLKTIKTCSCFEEAFRPVDENNHSIITKAKYFRFTGKAIAGFHHYDVDLVIDSFELVPKP